VHGRYGETSLFTGFTSGGIDWRDLTAFPVPEPAATKAGDAALEALEALLATVSPDDVDEQGEVPVSLVEALRAHGFLALRNESELAGLDLSAQDAFRVIERASRHSVAIGQVLAVQSGVGVPSLLPAISPGPLLEYLRDSVRKGALSGFAVTEPNGRNNTWPELRAIASGDGFRLRGEKLFTGNGPVAEVLAVSAVHGEGDSRRLCVCFVDTSDPGFQVVSRIEFTGSRGLPNGALRFDDVHVPAERVLVGEEGSPALSAPLMGQAVLLGMLYANTAPAVAIVRNCLEWGTAFVRRRRIDGRDLVEYEQVARILALNAADAAALDSAVRWSVPADNRWFERTLLKNLSVRTAWRVVDRTVSLLGGEGIETVRSKRRRGADTMPVERALRDARVLRVMGNVDFQLDYTAMRQFLAAAGSFATATTDPDSLPANGLDAANHAHLRTAAWHVRRFAEACADLSGGDVDAVGQLPVALLGRIAGELTGVLTLLASTAVGPTVGDSTSDGAMAQHLADIHCAEAEHRLADLWRRFGAARDNRFVELARSLVAGKTE
jgi:alkylation response protein AidB-like acyl-CoA dehydrogenase